MGTPKLTVLVVGATGSIGRLVEVEALRQGHAVRALVRDLGRARGLPPDAQRAAPRRTICSPCSPRWRRTLRATSMPCGTPTTCL